MRSWARYVPCFVLFLTLTAFVSADFDEHYVLRLREEAREMFYHGYDNYLTHAYPDDEIKPRSCSGRRRDGQNPRGTMDDSLGDYSLTLVDAMDTLVVLGDYQEFENAVSQALSSVHFDRNVTVNLFEVNIRVLGGLLSSHILASQLQKESLRGNEGYLHSYQRKLASELNRLAQTDSLTNHQQRIVDQVAENTGYFLYYRNELLQLALDLGIRLLPAWNTPTRIPFSKINLKYGVPEQEDTTCLAGAGTLSLEFMTLSELTGYRIFADVSLGTLKHLCSKRNALGFIPGMINVQNGKFTTSSASIGAGSDSFYEYVYKTWMISGDDELKECFFDCYHAIEQHMESNGYYYPVTVQTGKRYGNNIDSLQSFWPGLQVQVGNLSAAIISHYKLWKIWNKYHFMPESYYPALHQPNRNYDDYPLRPEFIESSYFLYQATSHSFYRHVGERVLRNINKYTRVPCGFASIGVSNFRLDDRMDSFFLSETMKYLYLLFEEDHWLSHDQLPFIFTTEAHPYPYKPSVSYKQYFVCQRGYIATNNLQKSQYQNLSSDEMNTLDDYVSSYFSNESSDDLSKSLDSITPVITLVPEHLTIQLYNSEIEIAAKFLLEDSVDGFERIIEDNKHLDSLTFGLIDSVAACGSSDQKGENIDDLENMVIILAKNNECTLMEMISTVQSDSILALIVIDNDPTSSNVWSSEFIIDDSEPIVIPIAGVSYKGGEALLSAIDNDNDTIRASLTIKREPQILISVSEDVKNQANVLQSIIAQVQNLLSESNDVETLQNSISSISIPIDPEEINCSDDMCTNE